jgi:hypothetical protein
MIYKIVYAFRNDEFVKDTDGNLHKVSDLKDGMNIVIPPGTLICEVYNETHSVQQVKIEMNESYRKVPTTIYTDDFIKI